MENFLRKIKLIEGFSIELTTTKSEFTSALRSHVDEADIDSFFSRAFEAFSSSKNLFIGSVSYNEFKIRKRRRLFDRQFGCAKITGQSRENSGFLIVSGKLIAWNSYIYFWFGFVILLYLLFVAILFSHIDITGTAGVIVIPFLFLHACLMLGIPYLSMRKAIKRLREDLEREFYYIINKPKSNK
ncbi:hypothetical protein [uncultured Psychroserpens sp.]|uniref:hypothetical protein n=1 Tax=uncultured Psychroserpens sp. TaxID=255436 RepID=UPI002633BDFC|nr:hypothetical protein [uncultured Psychroserpens sp.]